MYIGMKRIIFLALLLTSTASAAWSDLKEGIDQKSAEKLVGAPLFGNRSRGGMFMNWVYDNGGYILFENGRVRFWQQPADRTGGAPALAGVPILASEPAAAHASASSESARSAASNGIRLHW